MAGYHHPVSTLAAATMILDALPLTSVSFAVGIIMGITGMGGGALMTPALVLFGIPPTAAVSNDLVAASLNKTVGAATHWRRGSPNMKLAGFLIAGSVPTAFIGAFVIQLIGSSNEQDRFLQNAIGVTLLVAAATYAARMYLSMFGRHSSSSSTSTQTVIRPVPTVAVGAVGGLFVGITSVGSGSLIMVAMLIMYPTLAAVKLVGTDLVQAVPLVLAAAIGHILVTGIDWHVLIPLIIGGTPGTFLGSRIANAVSQSIIRRGITFVLALAGLSMFGVPPVALAIVAVALATLGPLIWSQIRVRHGLPRFARITLPGSAQQK